MQEGIYECLIEGKHTEGKGGHRQGVNHPSMTTYINEQLQLPVMTSCSLGFALIEYDLFPGGGILTYSKLYRLFRYVMHHQNKRGLVFDSS